LTDKFQITNFNLADDGMKFRSSRCRIWLHIGKWRTTFQSPKSRIRQSL